MTAIPPGTTVLTVNTRLARWLFLQDAINKKKSGAAVWRTPDILPFDAWIRQIWADSWPDRYILTPFQSERLWERIVRDDPDIHRFDLLQLRRTAEQVAAAYGMVVQYRLKINRDLFLLTEEHARFMRWAEIYRARLAEMKALDPAEALDAVQTAIQQNAIPVPAGPLCLAGFDEVTPQNRDFINLLQSRGVAVTYFPEEDALPPPAHAELLQFPTRYDEVVHCARWIRKVYEPGKRVGIVVPDLENSRSLIRRQFLAELAPASIRPGTKEHDPFNISLGTPLSTELPVRLALNLVSQASWKIPLALTSTLLGSPFISGSAECGKKSSLDLHLREEKLTVISLDQLLSEAEKHDCTDLKRILKLWKSLLSDGARKQPGQWAAVFAEFFTAIGWPGEKDSAHSSWLEIQNAWMDCLDILASLDNIAPPMSRLHAAETLEHIAATSIFQKKNPEYSIQVVGLLESSGMHFDHLWVMHCRQETLPAAPSPNPFLPMGLQRSANLPHSNALRELEFAEALIARLLRAAPSVTFSFSRLEGDVEHEASSLLLEIADVAQPPPTQSSRKIDQLIAINALEEINPAGSIALHADEAERFKQKGAAYALLEDQSLCPFRAFARFRLHADSYPDPESDYDAASRGSAVHRAIQLVWEQIKTHDQLKSLTQNGRLRAIIEDCAEQALNQYPHLQKLQPYFAALEKDRLMNLLSIWLAAEATRPAFEVVATEKSEDLRLAGLAFRLRIDRIDRTASGRTFLIDYKTGSSNIKFWFDDRIGNTQLPLYSITNRPDALVFAKIKKSRDEKYFQGVADPGAAEELPGLIPFNKKSSETDWQRLLDLWERKLKNIAGEFLAGRCEVDPVTRNPSPCDYCDYETLCRIGDRKQSGDGEEPGS